MTITDNTMIEQIAQSIFAAMLNMDLRPADLPIDLGPDALRATVRIAGEWHGRVVLELSLDLATAAAEEMLRLANQPMTITDRREVTTELVNMIGGNIKSALPGPSFISLPSILSDQEFAAHLERAEVLEDVTLLSEHGPMRVRLIAAAA